MIDSARIAFRRAYGIARKSRAELAYRAARSWIDGGGLDDVEVYEAHVSILVYGRYVDVSPPPVESRATRAAAQVAWAREISKELPAVGLQERLARRRANAMPWDDYDAYSYG